MFHRRNLEILDLDFLLLQRDPGDPGSLFLSLNLGDLGSGLSDFALDPVDPGS